MPHSTLHSSRTDWHRQSIASDSSVSFITITSHMVTNNKKAFKVTGAAPCQDRPPSSPKSIAITSAFSGAAQCPRRGRAALAGRAGHRKGEGAEGPAAPLGPAALRHSRPAAPTRPLRLRRHCSGGPPPRPFACRPPAIGHRRELPSSSLARYGMMGGAFPTRRAARPPPFPWRRERRRFRGRSGKPGTPGRAAGA